MANATAIKAWHDGRNAYLAVAVNEGLVDGVPCQTEYVGQVPLSDLAGKTTAEQGAMLITAVQAVRAASLGTAPAALPGFTPGQTVTV